MQTVARMMLFLIPVLLLPGSTLALECPEAGWAVGEWRGEIIGAGTVVVFRFESDRENCLSGNFDMPDHDARRMPFSGVDFDAERQVLEAHSDALNFRYQGQYHGEGTIRGTFTQDAPENGSVFALDLERVSKPGS